MQPCRRSLIRKGLAALFATPALGLGATAIDARQAARNLVNPIFQKTSTIRFDFLVSGPENAGGTYRGEFFKTGETEYGEVFHARGPIRRHIHFVEKDIHKTVTWGPGEKPVITIGRLDQVNVGYGLGDGMQWMELRLPWCDNRFQTLLEILDDPATLVKLSQVPNSEDRILELAKNRCQATLILSASHGFMPLSSTTKRVLKTGELTLERKVKSFSKASNGAYIPEEIQIKTRKTAGLGNHEKEVCHETRIHLSGIRLNELNVQGKPDLPQTQGTVVYDYLQKQVGKFDADGRLQPTGQSLPTENEYSPFLRINLDPDPTKMIAAKKLVQEKPETKAGFPSSFGQLLRGLPSTTK